MGPHPYGDSETCPSCGNHWSQGCDAECQNAAAMNGPGSFGRTSASNDFDLNSPWSAQYWMRKAIIDFGEHPGDADWDRWNEHATHGTEESEPQRHALEPIHGSRKHGWMGWGPDIANGSHHKVADWDWDNHLNAYVSTASPRRFTCDCGEHHPVPGYSNCKCGKTWNSYVIGTGGDRHEASVEKFLCREIAARPDVIVANRQALNLDDVVGESRGGYDLDDEVEDNTPFPSSHLPKVKDTMGSGGADWHSRGPGGRWAPGGVNPNRFKKQT